MSISFGTVLFLVLLTCAADCVDEQTAARKRKKGEAGKKKEDKARGEKVLKVRKEKQEAKLQKEKELKKNNRTTVVPKRLR